MKKFIIGGIALSLSFCLCACSNTQSDTALTRLSNQLDATTNTISNIQTVNPSDIAITPAMIDMIATKDIPSSVAHSSKQTQDVLLNEQYYRSEILTRASYLKNCISKDLTLSKAQASAVKELTESLSKYTNSISYTKSELSDSIQAVSNMKKNVGKNSEKINAKLNIIACNSNARSAFYENIINTLSQLESQVGTCCNNGSCEEKTTKPLKNIDTYISKPDECQDCDNTNTNKTISHYQTNPPFSTYNRYARFSSSRNTDTYGPTMRNIDTYGGFNNYGYGINNGYYGQYGIPQVYGNTPYANPNLIPRLYNSNNFNRMNSLPNQTPYVNADNVEDTKNDSAESNKIMTLEEPIVDAEIITQSPEMPESEENLPITAHGDNTETLAVFSNLDVNSKISNLMKK